MGSEIVTIDDIVYGVRASFDAVLSDKSIIFDREAEFAIQAIMANEYATKIAKQNRQSVVDAVTNVAAIGISLNPAKKQAYLVPRKGGICLSIGYMGLLDMAMDSGSIRWGQARLVHEHDKFRMNGLDRQPTHEYDPYSKDRGEIVGVYVAVKTADGDYLTEPMSVEQVNEIRDRSDAWQAYVTKKRACPWSTDWGEMAKKTCVHRAYKYWPKTERLEKAIHYLNTDGGEGVRAAVAGAHDPGMTQELISRIEACHTEDSLTQAWKSAVGELQPTGDMVAYEAVKAAVVARAEVLRNSGTVIDA